MKIVTFIACLIFAGAVMTFSADFEDVQPKDSPKLKSREQEKKPWPKTSWLKTSGTSKSSELAKNHQDFLKDYEKLSLAELKTELKRLDDLQKQGALIERANRGEVNEELSRQLTEYLRADFIVKNLILERKLDEIEEVL